MKNVFFLQNFSDFRNAQKHHLGRNPCIWSQKVFIGWLIFDEFLKMPNMLGHPRFGWTPFISHALTMNMFYYVGKYCIKVWKVKVTAVNSLLKCNKTKLQFIQKKSFEEKMIIWYLSHGWTNVFKILNIIWI